jgi:UDP-3-O-[3-hydroxymyristoyl] glucosamine N-acyltransferase
VAAPTLLNAQVRAVECGERVRIVEPANVYECALGDDCFVGPFVEIQRGVRVGARTKVQSHSFICELVEIGTDCFMRRLTSTPKHPATP